MTIPIERYHIVKITTASYDSHILASRVLTDRPLWPRPAIRATIRSIAADMGWDRDPSIIDFKEKLRLDACPSQIDIDEFRAVNWNPSLLMPESQLRWAICKLFEDGRFTVPVPEPGDSYGIQTYILAKTC